MLNITDQQGNANTNHSEIPPHNLLGQLRSKTKQQVLVRIPEDRNTYVLFVGV